MPTFVHIAITANAVSFGSSGWNAPRATPRREHADDDRLVGVALRHRQLEPLAVRLRSSVSPRRRLARPQRVQRDVVDDDGGELVGGRGSRRPRRATPSASSVMVESISSNRICCLSG